MHHLPEHIVYALDGVPSLFPGQEEEFIAAFSSRWGGLGANALAHAVREGQDADLIFALLALGKTATEQARETLIPMLASASARIRWISAIELGRVREPAALPVLFSVLEDFQPPDADATYQGLPHDWLYPVPVLLGRWGEYSAVPPLRAALQKAVQAELVIALPVPEVHSVGSKSLVAHRRSRRDEWQRFQDEVVYALGRLDAFGALTGLTGAEEHFDLWRVHLVMGHLHGRYTIAGLLSWHDAPELLQQVTGLLERCFGLNGQERASNLAEYQMKKAGLLSSIYAREWTEEQGRAR